MRQLGTGPDLINPVAGHLVLSVRLRELPGVSLVLLRRLT